MLRSILTIGAITGFIATGFVAPSQASLQTVQAIAKDQVRVRTVGSLLGGRMMSPKQAVAAANVLEAIAENDELRTLASRVAGSNASVKDIGQAAEVLKSVSVPQVTAKRALTTAAKIVKGHRITKHWKDFRRSADPFTADQMERIEWALKKNDIRLCEEVMRSSADNAVIDGPGAYLALCVAIVTSDPLRCSQILPERYPVIHSLCTDELAVL